MKKRNLLNSRTLATTTKFVAAFAVLLILAPVIRDINTVRSSEIDALLYKYLDEYNAAIRENPDMAGIILTAESNPGSLTDENKKLYVNYQRKFFDKWQVAWKYYRAGQLDEDRWDTWNTWFVAEATRRPQFGWIQNRTNYSGYFLIHVEDSMGILRRDSSIAETGKRNTMG